MDIVEVGLTSQWCVLGIPHTTKCRLAGLFVRNGQGVLKSLSVARPVLVAYNGIQQKIWTLTYHKNKVPDIDIICPKLVIGDQWDAAALLKDQPGNNYNMAYKQVLSECLLGECMNANVTENEDKSKAVEKDRPCKSNSVVLAASGKSTTLRNSPLPKATQKENIGGKRTMEAGPSVTSASNRSVKNYMRCKARFLSPGQFTEDILCPKC
ncbi:Protein Mono-Adp-Ribosyltransferase Parp4 [Manis pentadactyla]|nr:Protein Mono-Adp-Ribosyltransferase Parp4 [Manis pentadactyla]